MLDFTLGTLHCTVVREGLEWTVAYRYDEDRFVRESSEETTRVRTALRSPSGQLVLAPVLADRAVVVRPAHRVRIAPGEAATLFVSTPVWVRIEVAADAVVLADLPAQILSDTWFGPDTLTGQLAYANETQARMDVKRLPRRADRVTTPVTLSNEGGDLLEIERVNLPTTVLSVYESEGRLWSQGVRITREQAGDVGRLRLTEGLPDHLADPVLRSKPREEPSRETVTRALSMLFR